MSEPLLSIRNLSVQCVQPGKAGALRIVDRLSLELAPGVHTALVGESGCGKSTLARAILGLLPGTGLHITDGTITLGGRELTGLRERQLRQLRGRLMALIPQNPMNALNPVRMTGQQLLPLIMQRRGISRHQARAELLDMLVHMEFGEPEQTLRRYPHQLSGGMRQRAVIALALACRPRLLICDEATSALDAPTRGRVVQQMVSACARSKTTLLLITHDFGVVAGSCRDVAVMYCGQVVERAPAEALFARPRHPYTAGLLAIISARDSGRQRLLDIDGLPPAPGQWPAGCRFAPRCAYQRPECHRSLPGPTRESGGFHRCHFPLNQD